MRSTIVRIFLRGKPVTRALIIAPMILLALICGSSSGQEYTALLPLEGKGIGPLEVIRATEVLRDELVRTGRFDLVEREKLDEILDEVEHVLRELASDERAREIGKRAKASNVIFGSIIRRDTVLTFSVRMDDVGSGTVKGHEVVECEFDPDAIPVITQHAARTLARLPVSPLRGELTLYSAPSGAKVYEGSSYLGQTPLKRVSLDVEKHNLRAELAGYKDWYREVWVNPGKNKVLEIRLKASARRWAVTSRFGVGRSRYCDGYCFDRKTSFALGGSGVYYALRHIAIQPEVIYRNVRQEGPLYRCSTGEPSGRSYEIDVRYTDFNLLLVAAGSHLSSWRLRAFAGPYFGIRQSGRAKIIETDGAANTYSFDVQSDLGLILGFGVETGGFGRKTPLALLEFRAFWGTKAPAGGGLPEFGGTTILDTLVSHKANGVTLIFGIGY